MIKYIAVGVASALFMLALCSLYNYYTIQHKEIVYYPYYTTVYHLQAPSAWELISANAATDTAYYIAKPELMAYDMPELGDEVTFYSNFTGIIKDVTMPGFSIEITHGQVIYGMSGMPVYNKDGDVIGYISAATNTNELYCIWR